MRLALSNLRKPQQLGRAKLLNDLKDNIELVEDAPKGRPRAQVDAQLDN